MAGRSRVLTSAQQRALEAVSQANLEKRRLQVEGMAELRAELAKRVSAAELAEAMAVGKALSMDVLKSLINKEGLHTSNPDEYKKVMAKFPNVEAVIEAIEPEPEEFVWLDDRHSKIAVNINGLEGEISLDGSNRVVIPKGASEEFEFAFTRKNSSPEYSALEAWFVGQS